jgi:hypothetical protein
VGNTAQRLFLFHLLYVLGDFSRGFSLFRELKETFGGTVGNRPTGSPLFFELFSKFLHYFVSAAHKDFP